jgi:hypothetical protein
LSLDPQTTYKSVNEARFDFSSGSLEEQQASALGRIAHPNAFIQFFLANGKNTFKSYRDGDTLKKTADVFQVGTVIGTVPSTVDDIPVSVPPQGCHPKSSINFQVGHFGAVSESGIYYNSTLVKDTKSEIHVTPQHPISTKIDVPYSYVFRNLRQEAASRGPPMRKVSQEP